MAGTSDMFWASAVSERVDTREAVREAAAAIQAARSGTPDLVIAFVSPHHAAAYDRIGGWVRDAIGEVTFIGASATGVIGGGRELEGREGLSLTAAFLPDARISAFSVAAPPGDGSREAWVQALEIAPDDRRTCLVLIDPKTCDSESLLRTLDSALPKGLKIGGLASPYGDGPAALFAAESVQRGGALLCLLDGAFETQSVVAQGCRPIGEPLIVTRVKGNVIRELNAGKPTEVLRKLYETLDGRDHALFNSSLFLGLEMQGKQGQLQQGDFLIRNILGIDTEAGA
ncbi:MAG TPA: FIST N-terminal domain-containing protein, partial [Polyangiales bacterium]|nr:FIST N-terminal domain-containing protein [Polyangiales bacterium]